MIQHKKTFKKHTAKCCLKFRVMFCPQVYQITNLVGSTIQIYIFISGHKFAFNLDIFIYFLYLFIFPFIYFLFIYFSCNLTVYSFEVLCKFQICPAAICQYTSAWNWEDNLFSWRFFLFRKIFQRSKASQSLCQFVHSYLEAWNRRKNDWRGPLSNSQGL